MHKMLNKYLCEYIYAVIPYYDVNAIYTYPIKTQSQTLNFIFPENFINSIAVLLRYNHDSKFYIKHIFAWTYNFITYGILKKNLLC